MLFVVGICGWDAVTFVSNKSLKKRESTRFSNHLSRAHIEIAEIGA